MNKRTIKEYRAWKNMKSRCYSPSNKEMGKYQHLGIQVCERWKNSYSNFIEDMGYAPDDNYSLDRIDSTGNYEPSNCRWADKYTQTRNRGDFNIPVEYNGETKVLKEWCLSLGLKYDTMHDRITRQGLSFIEAISIDIKRYSLATSES